MSTGSKTKQLENLECGDYEPIQNIKNLNLTYGEEIAEDAGCDTCIHFNGGCEVYQK